MPFRVVSRLKSFVDVGIILICCTGTGLFGGTPAQALDPLPLTVAAQVFTLHTRSPLDLSPDGQWLALTYATGEIAPPATTNYSATGFPLAEGAKRTRIGLSNTRTGEVIHVGDPHSSGWGAVWSPDGERLAYYGDEGGEAGLWIWEKSSRKARRIPSVIVRPFFGFEVVHWMRDSRRLLCKILPVGMSVDQANALEPDFDKRTGRFPTVAPDQPSVFVLTNDKTNSTADSRADRDAGPDGAIRVKAAVADLAIVDLRNNSVTRIAERTQPRFYRWSPDESHVAYTVWRGWEHNTQQPIYDLALYELSSRKRRIVASGVRMGYGMEWNWSPDSRHLAYIPSEGSSKSDIVIITIADGVEKGLGGGSKVPGLSDGRERPPVWDARGENIYAIRAGKLWKAEIASGLETEVASIPGHRMTGIVGRPHVPTIWSTDGGSTVWVFTREEAGPQSGIYSVNTGSGESAALVEQNKEYVAEAFSVAASEVTKQIVFVARDQQHLADAWLVNTRDKRVRQLTRLNESLSQYRLGVARTIEWRSIDGKVLRGALLLPPNYREGQRVPLMVLVYGGRNGSAFVNKFGLQGDYATGNMHVLATRGYAVLFPDAPVQKGTPMKDIMNTVMPGVTAAIEQGYADPDRIAVMGHSNGAYSTLSLIAQSKRFKAAVITAAVINPDLFANYLEMGSDGTAVFIGYYEHGGGNMGGSPWEYHDRYLNNSPLFMFDQIETPLLIGQGEKDGSLFPSNAIFVALRRLGQVVEYRIYENEGHVLSRKANIIDFWQRSLDFLAVHLDVALDAKGSIIFDGDRAKSRRNAATPAPRE